MLEHESDNRLLGLAPGRALPGKEQVLGQLLADGGAAGDDLALLQVLLIGLLDGLEVKALVLQKLAVLGGNDGPLQVVGDLRVGRPLVLELRIGVLSCKNSSRCSMKLELAGL